jgi:hypothetical protein
VKVQDGRNLSTNTFDVTTIQRANNPMGDNMEEIRTSETKHLAYEPVANEGQSM